MLLRPPGGPSSIGNGNVPARIHSHTVEYAGLPISCRTCDLETGRRRLGSLVFGYLHRTHPSAPKAKGATKQKGRTAGVFPVSCFVFVSGVCCLLFAVRTQRSA